MLLLNQARPDGTFFEVLPPPAWGPEGYDLIFEPDGHAYSIVDPRDATRRIAPPSVTQVIGHFVEPNKWFKPAHLTAGTERHLACELLDLGGQVEADRVALYSDKEKIPTRSVALNDNTRAAIDGWSSFLRDFGVVQQVAIEEPVCAVYDYPESGPVCFAGTVDRVVYFDDGMMGLIDIKGPAKLPHYLLQLAAYESAWQLGFGRCSFSGRGVEPRPLSFVDRIANVHLRKDGGYEVEQWDVADPAAVQALETWRGMLSVYYNRGQFGLTRVAR